MIVALVLLILIILDLHLGLGGVVGTNLMYDKIRIVLTVKRLSYIFVCPFNVGECLIIMVGGN